MPDVLTNSPVVEMLTFDCNNCRLLRDTYLSGLNELVEEAMLGKLVLTCCYRRKMKSDWLRYLQKLDWDVASPHFRAHLGINLDLYSYSLESIPIFPCILIFPSYFP